jgi:hypothetical protein
MNNDELIVGIKKLVGKKNVNFLWEESYREHYISDIGHSQFNEILISFGCSSTSKYFFEEFWGKSIESPSHFHQGINKFRVLALQLYGNISYAYNILRFMPEKDFIEIISKGKKISRKAYENRHKPVYEIKPIEGRKTPHTGYFFKGEIEKRKENDPTNEKIQKLDKESKITLETAKHNHNAYLCSDHMDVYVATSMRKPHEFVLVNEFCNKIFSSEDVLVKDLKLRWFDPTQACCSDRIDKGLSEALMLKRSKCTLYLIQESDTLGKASEMASTLAQGKTVIAYVPKIDSDNLNRWINWFTSYSEKPYFDDFSQVDILRELAKTYCENELLTGKANDKFSDWFFGRDEMPIDNIIKNIVEGAKKVWDKRADTLKETHPLGIQVDLKTGVANGVLVARDEKTCVDLVYQVMLNQMEFDVEDKDGYVFLRERKTGCIYRVSSNDSVLVNSFWNYYTK